MNSCTNHAIEPLYRLASLRLKLGELGISISRYGLAVVLLLIGFLKFTLAETAGVQPLVEHSSLMSWMYRISSVQSVSNLIVPMEIALALLLALRLVSARASLVGSLGSVVTFLLTTSILFSTPGAVQLNRGMPVLGEAGQFLIKDVVLLGASNSATSASHDVQGQSLDRLWRFEAKIKDIRPRIMSRDIQRETFLCYS